MHRSATLDRKTQQDHDWRTSKAKQHSKYPSKLKLLNMERCPATIENNSMVQASTHLPDRLIFLCAMESNPDLQVVTESWTHT